MMEPYQEKLARLRAWMRQFKSAIVAYSGGVDSAVLMAVAHQELGERALACIGTSPSYPKRELDQAVELARSVGANHRLVETHEYLDPGYSANPSNRCYYCKSDLYDRLLEIAKAEGWEIILDGNNADDVGDDRPGRTAAGEHGVRSPLIDVGITKDEVRQIAKSLGLPVWNKPSMPCLSSRVPHGTAITPELLRQIEKAEDVLYSLGFRQYRVRHHGSIARIELPQEIMDRALERAEQIVAGVRAAGYQFVCLDLAAFRSGSLHAATAGVVPLTIGKKA